MGILESKIETQKALAEQRKENELKIKDIQISALQSVIRNNF